MATRAPAATAAPFWTAAGAAAEAAEASAAAAAAAATSEAGGPPSSAAAATAAVGGEPPAGAGGVTNGDWSARLDALADGASAELAAKLHPRRDQTLWWASAAEGADLAAAAVRKADVAAAEAAARSPAYAPNGESLSGSTADAAAGGRRRGGDLRAAFRAARARAAGGGVRADSPSIGGPPGWASAAGVGEGASAAAAAVAALSPPRGGSNTVTAAARGGRSSPFDQSPPEPDEPASLFDSDFEEGWGLFPRTAPAARRSGYTPVSLDNAADGARGVRGGRGALDDGSPPWRFFPMQEGESEAARQARLRAVLLSPGGVPARLVATALAVVVARELLEPAHPGAGAQLVSAARLMVGGGVGVLGHLALSAAALPVQAATAAARFTVDLL